VPEYCITGIGLISAIGNNVSENFEALKQGHTGIKPVKYLGTTHRDALLAEVKSDNNALKKLAGLPPDNSFDRTTLLGIIALNEALSSAAIKDCSNVALISSTSVGGMCNTEIHYPEYLNHQPYPTFINTHECAASTFNMAQHFKIGGYTDTISTACSSSANAVMLACNLIENGICDIAIAGGTDALSMFTLNGFKTLMILDNEWCRPFDESRAGLNLGEGAAYIVIESAESAAKRNVPVLAKVAGYANSNDAYHQTASSPDGKGATAAMQSTLQMAGISPKQVDYINAHGTATPNNDLSESTAIQNIFGDNWPPFSSTKAFTGHTLAAAGAIEAVYSVLSLQHNIIFPNLNFNNPIPEFNKRPITTLTNIESLNYILSNSFGFGGNCSSLLFSK
jgi:3-oxoacyl-[acyl-carrier-protein] synthase-1